MLVAYIQAEIGRAAYPPGGALSGSPGFGGAHAPCAPPLDPPMVIYCDGDCER